MSAEYSRLSFLDPSEIILHGLYPSMMAQESITYELLFYVTDDRGIEHYAQLPAVTLLKSHEVPTVLRISSQIVPARINSTNTQHR